MAKMPTKTKSCLITKMFKYCEFQGINCIWNFTKKKIKII